MAGYGNSMAEMRRKEADEKAAKDLARGKKGPAETPVSTGAASSMVLEAKDEDEDDFKKMGAHAAPGGPVDGAYQITMYRDGFTINNGPLRPTSDPINKKFVDEIARGQCPDELAEAQRAAGAEEDVPVSVTDKRGEDYPVPVVSMMASGAQSRAIQVPAKIENAISGGEGTMTVDAAKPTTKIQIRFHDGSKKAQEFNQDHTVGDLRTFCSQITGQPMAVKGGFPPKPMTDDTQTLKDAGLCGAAVTVMPA